MIFHSLPRPFLKVVALVGLVLVAIGGLLPQATRSAGVAAAFDPASVQLSQIAQLEGFSRAVDVERGVMAILGNGSLTFYDVAEPADPRALSTLALPALGIAVVIDGEYGYASWGSCEFLDEPGCSGGLDVYDLAMPTAPRRVGRITYPFLLRKLVVLGDTGYATKDDADSAIYQLDLRVPARPAIQRFQPEPALGINGVLQLVERADVGGRRFAYFRIPGGVAVSDLATGERVSTISLDGRAPWVDATAMVQAPDGRQLLVLASQGYGLHVVDLTDPSAPQLLAFVDLPGVRSTVAGSGVLYVRTDVDPSGFEISTLDLTNPAAPLLSPPLPDANVELLGGDSKVLIARAKSELVLYDLADPAAPSRAGAIPFASGASAYANGQLILESEGTLMTVDLRRPAALELRATGVPAGGRELITLPGTRDYLMPFSRGMRSLQLFDVEDPTHPRLLSSLSAPAKFYFFSAALGMSPDGASAYVLSACEGSGQCNEPALLQVYDLAEPSAPRLLSQIRLDIPGRLAVAERYAYLAYDDWTVVAPPAGAGKLVVFDMSNRAAPRALGSVPFAGSPQDIAVANGRVYIAAWWGGLHTIAVDDPAHPRLLSTYLSHRKMGAANVAVDGSAVFVSTLYTTELYTLDLSDPTSPRLVERAYLPGTGENLILLDDKLVATGMGITIYRRGSTAAVTVRDARGAPISDVSFQGTNPAGLQSTLVGQLATDLTGGLSVAGLGPVGTRLTPTFRAMGFSPFSHTVVDARPVDFMMLGAPATAGVTPAQATTLVVTDTQGLSTSLELPADALTLPTALTVRPEVVAPTGELQFAGQAFAISLADSEARFARPALLTLRYSRADVRLISDKDQLALYRLVEGQWVDAGAACPDAPPAAHDRAARQLQVAICAPGSYALLGPTERVNLPLVGR